MSGVKSRAWGGQEGLRVEEWGSQQIDSATICKYIFITLMSAYAQLANATECRLSLCVCVTGRMCVRLSVFVCLKAFTLAKFTFETPHRSFHDLLFPSPDLQNPPADFCAMQNAVRMHGKKKCTL